MHPRSRLCALVLLLAPLAAACSDDDSAAGDPGGAASARIATGSSHSRCHRERVGRRKPTARHDRPWRVMAWRSAASARRPWRGSATASDVSRWSRTAGTVRTASGSRSATIGVWVDVGSRDESPDHTGFAHLFEHLMFSGSVNIPSYDEPLQRVGGENNAFTSTDITNYYLSLPAANIETGFWLESDRMLNLAFSENGLDVQRKVVVEEFKQSYLNQPYGDVWLKLKPLAYQQHPYQWNTIGKEIAHIENAVMDDVRSFFQKHYAPQNAILVVAGAVSLADAKALAEKWFGPIPGGPAYQRQLPQEPAQTAPRQARTSAPVPLSALYKAYHMPARADERYYAVDLLSDVLGRGKSSRLHQRLVKEQALFNNISASVTGSLDPGLLVISGKLNAGVDLATADAAVEAVVAELLAAEAS